MAYIGNIPAESYASFERQVFTIVNSQTAYTLTHAVTNENDIRLVVNNVVQEPGSGKAYTASGTTLTLSAALVNGTDEMYCVYLGRALQTVNPPNASVGTAQLDSSLDFSSKTITLASNMKNTPVFFAHANANQDIANNTNTKVEIDTEILDSDGKFDTSNNRFTPTVAGYYIINGIARFDASTTISSARIKIYKNGSLYYEVCVFKDSEDFSLSISQVVYLDTDDYVELYVRQNSGSTVPINGSDPLNSVSASFSGFKLIGV